MELKLNIGYRQLLLLIRQLPINQINRLRKLLDNEIFSEKSETEITYFQKFLLNGPVSNDEQYNNFLENRKYFNQWRTT